MNPTVAPAPMFPERDRMANRYERALAPSIPGNRGPLRFEEGVATDTDVPNDFGRGAYFDTAPAMGRMNTPNPEAVFKRAEETMRERAHVGSAAWVEAPEVLGEFVQGSMAGDYMPTFEYSYNSGGIMKRPNPTVVYDWFVHHLVDESSSPPVLTMAKDTAQVSFADVASSFRRMRTDEFNSGHGRQDMIDISVPSAYVSTPREMVSQPKAMEGMGEFVVDPMQNLIPEGLPLEGRSRSDYAASTSVTSDPLSTSRLRSRGVAVYNKEARSGKA